MDPQNNVPLQCYPLKRIVTSQIQDNLLGISELMFITWTHICHIMSAHVRNLCHILISEIPGRLPYSFCC